MTGFRNVLVGWAPDLGDPTTFVMLRHGETEHTRQRRFSGGRPDGGGPELNELGRWQAAMAADHLARLADDPGTHHAAHPPIDVVVASPMARTVQTASIVADRLGVGVETHAGFVECDFGAWEGLTLDEVRQRHPDDLDAWFASTEAPPTSGESFEAVQQRVRFARDDVLRSHRGSTVLVVTHVTPTKSMVRLALDAPTTALYRMELAPASFTSVMWFADDVASLRFFNDTAHLRGRRGHGATSHLEGDGT